MRVTFLALILFVFATSEAFAQATTANVMTTPTVINVYWDPTWDADNPGITETALNAWMQALVASTYFSGLSEYGVTSVRFGGAFNADPSCGSRAAARPSTITVAQFAACEANKLKIPNAVYSIFFPKGSLERDDVKAVLGGGVQACTGPGYLSYHLNASTLLTNVLGTGIVYTAIFADPSCLDPTLPAPATLWHTVTNDASHELVEAITDPDEALPVIFSGGDDEIADKCDPPFSGAVTLTTPFLSQLGGGTAQSYFSNRSGACISGFGTALLPTITQALLSWPGGLTSEAPQIQIVGGGFGSVPQTPQGILTTWFDNIAGTLFVPGINDVPYLSIQDLTKGWEAGNGFNSNTILPSIASWGSTAVLAYPGRYIFSGDLYRCTQRQVVCNNL